MRFSLLISAVVFIAVDELLLSLAVLEEVTKISSIFGAAVVDKVSLAILLVAPPLALVIVALWRTPNPKTVLLPLLPLPLKLLSIVPHKSTLTASFTILKIPSIHSTSIPLIPTHLRILLVCPLVYLFFRDENTFPVLLLPLNLSKVNVCFSRHNYEVLLLDEGDQIELRIHGLVITEKFLVLFCLWDFKESVGDDRISLFIAGLSIGFGATLRVDVGVPT